MSVGTVDKVRFSLRAQVALRVLIASYFLAVALTVIPGVEYAALFSYFLPPSAAGIVAAGLVSVLTVSIMLGLATRLCAVVLALMTVYASALHVIAAVDVTAIARLWSDLALVGGLMLLYGERAWTHSETAAKPAAEPAAEPAVVPETTAVAIRPAATTGTALALPSHAPRRVNVETSTKMIARPIPRTPPQDAEMHNIFQAVDRAKAAMRQAQSKAEDPAPDHRPDAPVTFLRSEFGKRKPPETDPIDNIFVVDPAGRVHDPVVPVPRRVSMERPRRVAMAR